MKKAIYKPTNQNTIIITQSDGYCEILLDGEYKTVSLSDLSFDNEQTKLSTLDELKENIFINDNALAIVSIPSKSGQIMRSVKQTTTACRL